MNKYFTLASWNLLNKGDYEEKYERAFTVRHVQEADVFCAQEVVDEEAFTHAARSAGFPHVKVGPLMPSAKDEEQRVAVASKVPLLDPKRAEAPYMVAAGVEVQGVRWHVLTAHLSHGAEKEAVRLRECEQLDSLARTLEAEHRGSVSLLAGDLNALPESRSQRFLRGLDLASNGEYSTLWVDAYETCGRPAHEATTEHGANPLGKATARTVGVGIPELIPPRRIDYILTRGWAYGKNGCPVAFNTFDVAGEPLSDHRGVAAKLLIL